MGKSQPSESPILWRRLGAGHPLVRLSLGGRFAIALLPLHLQQQAHLWVVQNMQ